jgi:DNA repair exonuclease SbcCD nuclease subunit
MPKVIYQSIWISDIHMDRGLPHAKPTGDGRTDRLEDQIALWERVGDKAASLGVKDVWVLGDLFNNSRPDAVTLTATASCLSRLADAGLQVYLLPGNHDAVGVSGGRFTLEAFGALGRKGVKYIGARHAKPIVKADGAIAVWPVQFMPSAEAHQAIEEVRGLVEHKHNPINILALHQSITGCTHVGWTCDDGLDAKWLCDGFDFVISGHFHDPQTFGPGDRGAYLGAPMHHRFDDRGRRAGYVHLVVYADGTAERHFVDGGAPRFHEVDWGEDLPKDLAVGDYVRYRVRATFAEWTKLRPTVEEAVSLAQTSGHRASFRHDPVYHHDRRIKAGGELKAAATLRAEELISAYVDSPEVVTTGLDRAELKRLGVSILEKARAEHG